MCVYIYIQLQTNLALSILCAFNKEIVVGLLVADDVGRLLKPPNCLLS